MKKNKPFRELFFRSLKKILIIMRIATFLMILGILQVSAEVAHSQKTNLTLNLTDSHLLNVLDKIEEESGYYFLYNEKLIDINRKVNVHADNQLIDDILENILDGTKIKYTIIDNKIILAPDYVSNPTGIPGLIQQTAISGTITESSTGEPMPGVNIQVKGTTIGTISDNSGKYLLSVPNSNVSLLFSFIGYVPLEIPLEGRSVVDASLVSDVTALDEVVVVGYGTVHKQSLTGAIASIKTADIINMKTTSLASMIQGKIPGLMIRKVTGEPGAFNTMVSVRGFGAPLLVIDGVIRDGMSDFERLNPQDIESISVLKDASAAIYGMNADNGVLIVTTKSGTKGRTEISYTGTYTWKQPTTKDLQKTVDAYTYRWMKNEMSRQYRVPEPYSADELEKWRLGTEPGYTDFNWYDACIRDGIGAWQHNFSINGGTENVTHYTSFGYVEDNGLLTNNEINNYKKYNLRTSINAKLAKGLTAKIIASGKFDIRYSPPIGYFWLFKQINVADRGIGPFTLANPDHYTTVPAENVNPLAQFTKDAKGYSRNMNTQFQFTAELNYDIPTIKGLSFGLLSAYDGNLMQSTSLNKPLTLYEYKTDKPVSTSAGNITENMEYFTRKYVQGKISYRTSIAQAHNISAMLVNEIRLLETRNIKGRRQYDQIYTWDLLDQASTTNQSTAGGLNKQAFTSYLGRFNYDFKGKYLLEFAFREDGSYRYAPEKRWAFFPSGSVGWRISEEPFMAGLKNLVSNLKLRASYGSMGADAGNPFQYYPGYSLSAFSGGAVLDPGKLTLGMVPPGVINNNLSWVKTSTANIGIDIELWGGKLGLIADIFQKNRDGLLATRATSVPNTFGGSFPQENLNSDMFKGYDFEINHRDKIGSINYGLSVNVTYARQYYLHQERSPYTNTMEIWKDGNSGNGRIQGRGTWLYQTDDIYTDVTQYETAPLIGGTNGNSYCLPGTQRIVDLNGDGVINANDTEPVNWANTSNPPLQFGFNGNASWKNLDVSIMVQGASLFTYYIWGVDVWGYQRYPSTWTYYLDRWHQEDPTVSPWDPAAVWIQGKYAPLQNSWTGTSQGTATRQWYISGNYVRIKNLEIGYSLPSKLTRKVMMEKVRLSFSIVNLATFSRNELKKFDPEREQGEYNAGLTYPLLREFNFVLNVNF